MDGRRRHQSKFFRFALAGLRNVLEKQVEPEARAWINLQSKISSN